MVDADPDRRAVVRGAMRRRGDMMLIASSVEEARQRLEQSAIPIDWILIDVDCGGDSASRFAGEVKRKHMELGILLTVDTRLESEFKQLQKPYDTRELWAAMAREQ